MQFISYTAINEKAIVYFLHGNKWEGFAEYKQQDPLLDTFALRYVLNIFFDVS